MYKMIQSSYLINSFKTFPKRIMHMNSRNPTFETAERSENDLPNYNYRLQR